VLGATLEITNNLSQTVKLVETGKGNYETPPGWLAKMGKLYQLSIHLSDGREYLSENQLLYSAGVIDSLSTVYKPNSINQGNLEQPQHAVFVSIDGHGEPGQPNLFRWRWRGIFEILTYPELHTAIVGEGVIVPNPLPCSGYLTGTPCYCCNCWVTEKSTEAHIFKNDVVGDVFKDELITYIPVDAYHFSIKDYIEVEQLSLSDEVHEFWKRIEAQQQGASNIFQPNAIKIQGNIHPVTNPKEEVFGIFSVSGVVRKKRFLTSADIGGNTPAAAQYPNDCRLLFLNSSNVKPDFW
jgi:hypothetical protein